jgi:hypothetical protein
MPTVAGDELLEHTADLGIRAWAPTAPRNADATTGLGVEPTLTSSR